MFEIPDVPETLSRIETIIAFLIMGNTILAGMSFRMIETLKDRVRRLEDRLNGDDDE